MLLPSGANADRVPVCGLEATEVQLQPPGVQIGTTFVNKPSVPDSKPSLITIAQGVEVGVTVLVDVRVGVKVGGVPVGVGVGVPPQPLKLPMRAWWLPEAVQD